MKNIDREDVIESLKSMSKILGLCSHEREVLIKAAELIETMPTEWVRNIHDKEICPYCGKERWSK